MGLHPGVVDRLGQGDRRGFLHRLYGRVHDSALNSLSVGQACVTSSSKVNRNIVCANLLYSIKTLFIGPYLRQGNGHILKNIKQYHQVAG